MEIPTIRLSIFVKADTQLYDVLCYKRTNYSLSEIVSYDVLSYITSDCAANFKNMNLFYMHAHGRTRCNRLDSIKMENSVYILLSAIVYGIWAK